MSRIHRCRKTAFLWHNPPLSDGLRTQHRPSEKQNRSAADDGPTAESAAFFPTTPRSLKP
ncbi:hypothetical protein [Kingella potus]|uniref:hypothetical protein n=1 Tax=Kingella potus TaxID=265175 RepID=UPI001FD584E8|nr:hypothetical protein [Kingella potus]UOP01223.1 hypothetical protein LVJ84_02750 [Kingella potus]